MTSVFIILLIQLIVSANNADKQTGNPPPPVPELVIPVYEKVKDLRLDIRLVENGRPAGYIVAPEVYSKDARVLQSAIEKKTGVTLPVIKDTDAAAATPFKSNLIILGNRSTSKVSGELYDKYYSLMDLKYPGRRGYAIRSLHDPYGNGYGAVLIGGSDNEGVTAGVRAFVSHLEGLKSPSRKDLSVGWTMLTKLGEGIDIPSDIRNFETWEASKGYGSVGYFGWNSISKRMAMYYMTGDPVHAREVIRLSFPDAQALKEIDEIDGERIENKKDPLAGPYHYNALMLILFWDLIEESPAFSDAERLNVTNAFARRLSHEGTTPFDKNTYRLDRVPSSVGSRHGQWSALSLYTLARYFNKYYPSAMWAQAERAGILSFASLHEHAWVQGEGDQLGWYPTGIAPVLTYMILTGDRKPLENGVLQQLLRGQEVLITGRSPDEMLNSAALDFFNKAAYLTGDGRWITYRNRTGADTDIFRLGQSFWPDKNIKPSEPVDLQGKWLVHPMPEQMWQRRNNGFSLDQSFQNMSYRSSVDFTGDYIMLKGYNGAYRNPYHTFAIIELRMNGVTLLKGFNNQVLTSADGMVEPLVPMDAALQYHDVVGEVAVAVAGVPNLPYTSWKRSLIHRTGRYSLIADHLTFRTDGSDMRVRVVTNFETPRSVWMEKDNYLSVNTAASAGGYSYELHPSETMKVSNDRDITHMVWSRTVNNGQDHNFFYLLAGNPAGNKGYLSCIRASDNAAVLKLPEAALAVAGKYLDTDGELVLLSENNLYGHAITSAGYSEPLILTDSPAEVEWNFNSRKISLVSTRPLRLSVSLSSPGIVLNGKKITGARSGKLYGFDLPAGRHEISEASPDPAVIKDLSAQLSDLLRESQQDMNRRQEDDNLLPSDLPLMSPVMKADIGGSPVEGVVIPSPSGDLLCTATGNTISLVSPDGRIMQKFQTDGEVRVLHWWNDQKLLLAGCADENVIAFDLQGNRKWTFTSVMDPAVYEAGKPYWFKSAYPGIYGLYSGEFDNGKSRAFVGSACTLEILDENGQLVKRTPVFWGPGRQFLMTEAADGSKNLLIARWQNDWPTFVVVGSKTLAETGRGYNDVPPGHTFVNGWTAMNRYDNFLTDMDGDGKKEIVSAINGTWNRVTVYTESGKPLCNAQFGPGQRGARTNIRMMDVGDLDGDGKQEIVSALSAGFINVLDYQAKKKWVKLLPSPPTVVKIVKENGKTRVCAGCEDGTIVVMNESGEILKKALVSGRPVDIRIMNTPKGILTLLTTESGQVNGFRIE